MAHKHMKLKNNKKKRTFVKLKILFFLLVIYISFSYSFYYALKHNKKVSNEEFINLLLKSGSTDVLKEYKLPILVNKTMNYIFHIDFTKPSTIFKHTIFRLNHDVGYKSILLEDVDDYSNMEELKGVSDYISDPNPKEENSPIVYIYNSHQLENYNNSSLDIYGVTPNVMMASYVLREKLHDLGVEAIVEEANMSDILASHGWNYAYSYQASRSVMDEKIKKYNSLKYFIDIHRDSSSKELTTATINGKGYAKVLFVVGLDHDHWESNYHFANELNTKIESSYPGLSRGILKKTGMNVNGIYNQDVSPNCMLIEVGGVDNTIEEVYETINALADVLSKYILG